MVNAEFEALQRKPYTLPPMILSKPHHRMYAAGFLLDFSVAVGLTAIPFFVMRQLHGGPKMLGIIGAINSIVYTMACLVSARIVTKAAHGLNWSITGIALFAVSWGLAPLFHNRFICATLFAVGNFALALCWPAMHSWIGAEPDLRRRARRMGRFNIAWSLGLTVGPLMAGWLSDVNLRFPFILLAATAVLVFLLLKSLPHERDHFGQASQDMLDARAEHDRASEAFLYSAWFANLMGCFLANATRSIFPNRVEELVKAGQLRVLSENGETPLISAGAATQFSWLVCVLAFSVAGTFLLMGRSKWWHHNFRFLFWLQVAAAVAFWVLGTTHSLILMALCFLVVGIMGGATFFAAVFYSMADADKKHSRAAVNEGMVGAGGFLGSLAFGLLADRYSIETAFHCAPLFIAVGLAAQLFLLKWRSNAGRRAS